MRLWHIDLIQKLPRQQLLGQWREIHAIIGTLNKRGKVNHSTVNYVNDHPIEYLIAYANIVYKEMLKRKYNPVWETFIDKFGAKWEVFTALRLMRAYQIDGDPIYPEHNDAYLQECLENLRKKGIVIDV